jgi:hypothetical protein
MTDHLTPKQKKAYEQFLKAGKRIRHGSAPPKETVAQKQRRIKKLLKPENFEAFCQYYFASEDTVLAPFAWFHRKAIDNIFVEKQRKHLWEWHREAAKSVFADIFIPIYKLVRGELTGMILGSENEDKAKNLIKDVENQLRNNQKLIADFGSFNVTGTWLQSFFQTKDGVGFWAFGLGQNPAGVRNGFQRPNLGIIDDADSKKIAKNQKLTREAVDWIKGEFMGCLAKDDRTFIYLNNRVHKEGITAHMAGDIEEEMPKDDSFAHVKAYLTEHPITHEAIIPEWGTEEEMLEELESLGALPAWKEYYSLLDCVKKIRDYGHSNSQRQLYHQHTIEGDRFTDDNMSWVHCLPLEAYEALTTYCDPAYGESKKGCYRAIVLVGLHNQNYDVLDAWMEKSGSFADAQYRMAIRTEDGGKKIEQGNVGYRQKINCMHWVESNPLQRKVLKLIYKDFNQGKKNAWYPRFDMDQKGDKIGRIESLEPLADEGHIRFNIEKKKDRHFRILRDQLKDFPNGMVDGPDALEGAIGKLRKKGGSKSMPAPSPGRTNIKSSRNG